MQEFEMLWYYWMIIGIVLIVAETVIPLFIIVWFGVAALILGGVVGVTEMSLSSQLFLWGGLSVTFYALWFFLYGKKEREETKDVNDTKKEITVLKVEEDIIFIETAYLGSKRWHYRSDVQIAEGGNYVIKDIKGETLILEEV